MQAGASAGLQVAGLRQRGNLASAQLAQNAADREAARADAEARAAEALAFRRWEQEQQGRRAAAALAQQGQIAQAGVNQRGLAAVLRSRDEQAKQASVAERNRRLDETSAARMSLDQAKLTEQIRHAQVIEGAAADKLKRELELPPEWQLYKSGNEVIGVNPRTLEKVKVHSPEEKVPPLKITAVAVDPKDKSKGLGHGVATDPWIQQRLGTNLIPPMAISPAPDAPVDAVNRFIFDRETGKFVPKE